MEQTADGGFSQRSSWPDSWTQAIRRDHVKYPPVCTYVILASHSHCRRWIRPILAFPMAPFPPPTGSAVGQPHSACQPTRPWFERVRVAARSVLASERWPLVADLVEDRVSNRLVTVLLFVCVFTFVLRALYVVFLNTPSAQPQVAPATLRYVGDVAGQSAVFGVALSPVITLFVSRAGADVGVANTPVTVNLSIDGARGLAWQRRFGFEGTVLDYTGLPIDGRYSLPGFVPAAFLSPVVSGANVSTDANGFARLWDLSVELGLPGRYLITAAASGVQIDASRFDFESRVGTVVLPSVLPLTRETPSVALGAVLPRLQAQVLDLRWDWLFALHRCAHLTSFALAAGIPSPACAAFSTPRLRPSSSSQRSPRGPTRSSHALPSSTTRCPRSLTM